MDAVEDLINHLIMAGNIEMIKLLFENEYNFHSLIVKKSIIHEKADIIRWILELKSDEGALNILFSFKNDFEFYKGKNKLIVDSLYKQWQFTIKNMRKIINEFTKNYK